VEDSVPVKRFDRQGESFPLRDRIDKVAREAAATCLTELAREVSAGASFAVIREELGKLKDALGGILDFRELRTLRPQ
jgi:hypothetical protein